MRIKILAGLAVATLTASAMMAGSASAQYYQGSHHHHRGNNAGAAIAGFAAGAILGGALAAQPRYGYGPGYGPGYAGDNAVGYCMSRFKSYDPSSGTYLGYDGYRHACP